MFSRIFKKLEFQNLYNFRMSEMKTLKKIEQTGKMKAKKSWFMDAVKEDRQTDRQDEETGKDRQVG